MNTFVEKKLPQLFRSLITKIKDKTDSNNISVCILSILSKKLGFRIRIFRLNCG